MRKTNPALKALERAIQACGGPARLAEAVGVKRQAVNGWLSTMRTGRRFPAGRVLAVEKATGGTVSRHDLRPDLYPIEEAA